MNQEQAEKRITELKGYYSHLASFVAVNLFLIMINLINYSEDPQLWFVYPLFGWGIGLLIHTFQIFAGGRDWEDRKMQELTGWSVTREELERLSERTDNLVSILSNLNWEKIDPALVETKENLLKAREKIIQMQDDGGTPTDASRDEVVRELEKLEEFVTSAKFRFYDQAQSPDNPVKG